MDASYADLENAPSLNLDYNAVMSSWEKMGRVASGAAAASGSGELPLDLSFLEEKGFGQGSNEQDPLDIFTFCDLFDADDLTFSAAPQRRSPDGRRPAAASQAAAVVPGSGQPASMQRASSDMMVPCCERAGSGSLMPTFEQPRYEQFMHAPHQQAAEQQHQQQQQPQPTYMITYAPVMVQMSPFASYAASPFAPYANAQPFISEDGSGGGAAGPFYHTPPLMHSMHGCLPVSMSLIRAATGPLPPSPMQRQLSAPTCSGVLGRAASAAFSERYSNGGFSNLSRAASGAGGCNGAELPVTYAVSVAGGGCYDGQQMAATCRAGNGGVVRGCGRMDGTAESCHHHHTLNTGEPRTRAECLARYRSKKARRLHTKMIRYHLRKINADNRPRYKGRFVKKGEMLPPTIGEVMPPIVVDE